ncbi:MAG: maleamate amidohydrolase [Glaciecola sp.]
MTELDDNYAAAYAGVLAPGQRPALLNVDVCRAYVEVDSPLYAGVEASLESIARLTAVARTAGTAVYWTAVRYLPGGADGGRFYEKVPALEVFVEGNPLGDFTDVVAPSPEEPVVVKQYPSAFFGTTLAEDLHAAGIDTLVITGWSTSGCVRASALDALCHGFIPIVVRDAVGDRHPAPHEQNLFDLQAKYAEVVDEATATVILGG